MAAKRLQKEDARLPGDSAPLTTPEEARALLEKLKVSETRYRRLFETAQDGILLLDAKTGEITDVNPFLLGLLGYPYQEIAGKKLWEIGPFVDRALAKEAFETLQRERYIRYENLPLETAAGATIQVEFVSNTYPVGGKDVIQCNIRDIAQRKANEREAEATLQASDLRYRQVVENASEAIFVVQSGKIVFLNQRTSAMTGYTSEELMARAFADFVHPDDRDMVLERHQARTRGEEPPSAYAFRAVRADGVVRWVEVKVVRVDWQGAPASLNLLSDITERRQAEAALSRSFEATLTALGRAAEMRDPYTAGHQRRVTDLALAIAHKLGWSDDTCGTLRIAGMLHDVGKLRIPAEILSKPGALSPIEVELIRIHPQAAYEILVDVALPGPVAEIVLQHHERLDGSGYPRRISGDDILIEARVLAVADVVEAMVSHRPYRPALGVDAALKEIQAGRGTRYDVGAADACLALFESGQFSFTQTSPGWRFPS